MNRTTTLWAMVLFFGSSIVFVGLHTLTEDSTTSVRAAAQVGALLGIVAAVMFVVQRMDRDP